MKRLQLQGYVELGSVCNKGERVLTGRDGPNSFRILGSQSFVLPAALEILPFITGNLNDRIFFFFLTSETLPVLESQTLSSSTFNQSG